MSCGSHVFPVILQWFSPSTGRDPRAEDGPGDAAGGEASAAEVGEFDAKVGGAKKIQDVDKAQAQGAGRRAQLLKLMGGVILMVNLSHG